MYFEWVDRLLFDGPIVMINQASRVLSLNLKGYSTRNKQLLFWSTSFSFHFPFVAKPEHVTPGKSFSPLKLRRSVAEFDLGFVGCHVFFQTLRVIQHKKIGFLSMS